MCSTSNGKWGKLIAEIEHIASWQDLLVCFLYVLYVCNVEFIFTGFLVGSIYDNIEEDVDDIVDW